MSSRLLYACQKAERIFIYGAGTIADIFFIFLKQKGLQDKVRAFVVTDPGGNPAGKSGVRVRKFSECIGELQNALVAVAVQEFLQDEIGNTLRENGIYGCYRVDSEKLLDDFYTELYKEPVCGSKILFQNQMGEGYGGNPKYIAEKLLEYDRRERLDLVWAVSKHREGVPGRIRQVLYGSEEYYRELATARVWIDNSRKAYSIRKREGQFYMQAWHGAAPVKRVEADVQDRLPEYYIEGAKNDSRMADVFLSGSRFYSELYRRSFWYEGLILEAGLPRHDIFWDTQAARHKVYDLYGLEKEASIVLYAPTFRSYYDVECYDLDIDRIVEALEKRFCRPFRMLVSRHPVNCQEYSFKKDARYLYAGDHEDFQELLAAADVLITDYSGCMYDFSYTGRPVFLYQKDYEKYLQDRDFYISMDRLPYIKAHSNKELEEAIEEFDAEEYSAHMTEFMHSMGNFDTGNASERVAHYLRENVIGF